MNSTPICCCCHGITDPRSKLPRQTERRGPPCWMTSKVSWRLPKFCQVFQSLVLMVPLISMVSMAMDMDMEKIWRPKWAQSLHQGLHTTSHRKCTLELLWFPKYLGLPMLADHLKYIPVRCLFLLYLLYGVVYNILVWDHFSHNDSLRGEAESGKVPFNLYARRQYIVHCCMTIWPFLRQFFLTLNLVTERCQEGTLSVPLSNIIRLPQQMKPTSLLHWRPRSTYVARCRFESPFSTVS